MSAQRFIPTASSEILHSTSLPTHDLAKEAQRLNTIAQDIITPEERLIQLASLADRTILLTSGGRNAPQSIAYLAKAIQNSPKVIAEQLIQIPIVFLDLQNHPVETYKLLLDLKLRYPDLNFRRFTYDFENDSELKQAINFQVGSQVIIQNTEDPRKGLKENLISAFFQQTKIPLIYSLLIDANVGLPKAEYIIGGNRRSQSKSRNTLPFAQESFYKDRGFIHVYPLFDQTNAQVTQHESQAMLPVHQLDANKYPSVGIWYEMFSVDEVDLAQKALTKSNRPDECGIHRPQTEIQHIPIREVTDWSEELNIAKRYPNTHQWMLEELAKIGRYNDFQI